MSFAIPPTKAVGNRVTAAEWNTYIRGNFLEILPYTQKGDIAVATGAADVDRLAVGADYQVLQARAGATLGMEWSGYRGCMLTNADVNCSSGAVILASFTVEAADTDGYHESVTNPSRITIPTGMGGMYHIGFSGYWDGDASAAPKLEWIYKGGSPWVANYTTPYPYGADYYGYKTLHTIQPLVAGDYLQLYLRQATAGGLSFKNVVFYIFMVR